MVLNKMAINTNLKSGVISIKPHNEKFVNPSGYDLHLGKNITIFNPTKIIDLKKEVPDDSYKEITLDDNGFLVLPNMLVLGVSVEWTKADGLLMMYEGKSSLGRLGVESHICAGAGDVGFEGHWTLEIRVMFPTRIYPGMPIGQIMFFDVLGFPLSQSYKKIGSYNNEPSDKPKPIISNYHTKIKSFYQWS